MKLIGLAGRARVGKDTAAEYMQMQHGFVVMAFADPIRWGLQAMLRVDSEPLEGDAKEQHIGWLGVSGRQLMQDLGTGWGRYMVREDLWVLVAERRLANIEQTLASHGNPHAGVVFSDVRFPEEAQWIRARGGRIVHLSRQAAQKVREHESEHDALATWAEAHIDNDGTREALYARLDDIIEDIGLAAPASASI